MEGDRLNLPFAPAGVVNAASVRAIVAIRVRQRNAQHSRLFEMQASIFANVLRRRRVVDLGHLKSLGGTRRGVVIVAA